MRRVLPYLLVGVLGIGAVVGAVLGQAESPGTTPGEWVDGVLAATAAAGSAHFRYTNVTTSPDPSEDSTAVGTGVVDFAQRTYRDTEVNRQNQYESTNGGPPGLTEQAWGHETIAIGQTVYVNLLSSPVAGWSKTRFPRNVRSAFGLAAGTGAEDALAGLSGTTPVATVHTLGPGSVGGVPATRYVITDEPLYVCGPHGRTVFTHDFAPTTLWVDGQNKLLRVQTSFSTKAYTTHGPPDVPGGARPFVVPAITIRSTLTFSDLGAPVHITAPKVTGGGGSTTLSLQAKGSTSPCRG